MQIWAPCKALDCEVCKRLTNAMGDFIYLSYSLAQQHQQFQCYLNTNTAGLPFGSVNDIEVGPGERT